MDFDVQRRALAESGASLLTFRETNVFTDYGRGIRPVLDRLSADPDFFRGAAVADKVIGRSAALLFLYGGAAQVYAGVLSVPAEKVLRAHGGTLCLRRTGADDPQPHRRWFLPDGATGAHGGRARRSVCRAAPRGISGQAGITMAKIPPQRRR